MRRRAIIGALLLIALGVLVGGTVFRDQVASAKTLAQAVFVNNTPADPVPVQQQGTATVQVSREPFQAFLATTTTGGTACTDVVSVPSGKRLTIENVSAESDSPGAQVYLEVIAKQDGLTDGVDSLPVPQSPTDPGTFGGDVQTLLFSGEANDPRGFVYSYALCIHSAVFTDVRGFVSGYLEPAP